MADAPAVACRINKISDDVLLRALSHLDALQVVQISVLSRRWRDRWRSVPRINATHEDFNGAADQEEECDVLFKAFFNRFLMLRNPVALDEFRLVYRMAYDSADLLEDANLWIHHALQSSARSVQISCWTGEYEVALEPAVFASKCFLTSLLLDFVFVDDGFFRSLQMGCTLLERLILRFCTIYAPEISSQTLRVLTIDDQCYCTYFEGQATISIPSLIGLHLSSPGRVPLLKNMESLMTASVSICDDDTQVDDIRCFLLALSGVTDLEFNYKGDTVYLFGFTLNILSNIYTLMSESQAWHVVLILYLHV
jgi:hypothetical protein